MPTPTTAQEILSLMPDGGEVTPSDLAAKLPHRDPALIRNTLRRMVGRGDLAETATTGGYALPADEPAPLPGGGPDVLGYLEGGHVEIPDDVFLVFDLPGAGQMHIALGVAARRVGPPIVASGRFGPAASTPPTAATAA